MPKLLEYPRYALQLLRGERLAGERDQQADCLADIAPMIDMQVPRQILDLANGRLRPQYTLFKRLGHAVTGIDMANWPQRSAINLAYVVARQIYTWRLGITYEPRKRRTLVCGDVGRLPFPDAAYDLVISAAAFEHFLDVPAVVAEVKRVLKPGGVAWISIHPFACPSGGHNVTFTEYPLQRMPAGMEAWDHLRQRRIPFTVPLNEWRQAQYVAEFTRHFEIIKTYCRTREGDALLTTQIEAELRDYSRDELTCLQFVIVARKPL